MYLWERAQMIKEDPYSNMIDLSDASTHHYPQKESTKDLQYTSIMTSAAHTYGNALAFIQKWVLDLFPKDLFKTIHVNSKITHRQMIQTDLRAQSKKMNPKIIFRPRIAGLDEERFLKGTPLVERMTNYTGTWGAGSLRPFFTDNQNNFEVRYQMNRSILYVDVVCVFNTLLQQINYASYLQNRIGIGHNTNLSTCLESYIPRTMINMLSKLVDLPVVDKDGCTKAFMEYLNGHSQYPITYKISGATGNREFYRYYPCLIDTVVTDLNTDEGERTGQVMSSYQMSFTVRMEYESTGFYYLFGTELERVTHEVPDINDDELLNNTDDIVPVFTDIMCKEDLNLKPGWHLYNQASCRLEECNDHINIKELLNQSIIRAIEYHHKNGLPCSEFLDIKIRRQGELLLEGKDYFIDYQTFEVYFHNDTVYFTYKILININAAYINELIKTIYHLE